MSKINNAPARYEGPHSQLGALIRREAALHLAVAEAIESADPESYTGSDQSPAMRTLNIEVGIWQMLSTGWARPLVDWSGMVFWHPVTQEFVPWDAELNLALVALVKQIRPVVEAYTGEGIPRGKLVDHTGTKGKRKPAVVMIDDSDKPGPIH